LGSIYAALTPFKGLMVFISEPELVEKVMTDKDTFPTRGTSGLNSTVGEGLLALPTGPKWAAHRRIVSQFLTENYLTQFSRTGFLLFHFPSVFLFRLYLPTPTSSSDSVEDELKIMMKKWTNLPEGKVNMVCIDIFMLTVMFL
jgi:hypothetical protein